jgi:2,4-dichlorophenol 6-monooxygenase
VSAIAEDGCLLVRPDGYIAWRHESSERAQEALDNALNQILCR